MAGLSGKTLGGFRILEQIQDEESAQGIVCKAICERENPKVSVSKGQIVALKVMPVRDDDRRQQWRKLESRTNELSRLNHPNIVRYYGCFCEQGEWNQLHVIVQEFLEGETLKERLERFPAGLDVDEGLKIIDFAIDGLAHTASMGIVHRDIKPGNVFICEEIKNGKRQLSVKLIDFEIAKQGQGSTTASTGNMRGSFNYMAPEFLDARFRGDLLSDVFSMGVTLHETLTGKLPYDLIDGNGEDAILDFVARWKGLAEGKNPVLISPDVNRLLAHTDKLFLGCLSPERERRFCKFEDFRAAIKDVRFRTLTNPVSGTAYQMLQFIGKGGFGEVFKARESKTGQIVAIKHLRKARYAERFKREAKILAKFDDKCFVRFVESFSRELDGRAQEFLVMGFLDGMPGNSLWDAIKRSNGAGLPVKDVFTAFIRYAHGLKMLHAAGIFHRDIKPSNLYFPSGKPELSAIMDLGIARDTKGTMTVGSVPGTPDYMPPEVVTAGSRGESGMDVYALGLCMYEALTAKTAFARLPSDIEGFKRLVERVNSKAQPRFDDGRIDADVFDLLTDMTAFNPAYRIKDIEDVERRLREFLIKLGSLNPDPISAPDPERTRWGALLKKSIRVGGSLALVGVILGGALKFAFPFLKNAYAENRLGAVLDGYRKHAPEARDLANAWIVEFNPRSYSWLRLDEETFVKCTNAMFVIKQQMIADQVMGEWQNRIGGCLTHDGKLKIDAFGELNKWKFPSEFADEVQIKASLSDLGLAVREMLKSCVAMGDVKNRKKRLALANEILANEWTRKLLDAGEMRRMRKTVDAAMEMCVGSVHNGCSGVIEVCGEMIGVNETKAVAVKDGRPERQLVTRQGHKPIHLPTEFDGLVFAVDDSTFEIEPIRISVPRLADGLSFFLKEHEYFGGETLVLDPGRYVGKYVRKDKTHAGEKVYKDCLVEFFITPGGPVRIPAPENWEFTDQYLNYLASPVDVEMPELNRDVRCRIDDEICSTRRMKLVPGRHLCIYEKPDFLSQTNSFTLEPGRGVVLQAPHVWKPTAELNILRDASKSAAKNSWADVERSIRGIKLEAAEHVDELERLRRGVSEWRQAEVKRINDEKVAQAKKLVAERAALREDIEKLLDVEPIPGRRGRLGEARKILSSEKAQRILEKNEIEKYQGRVRNSAHLVVGRITNGCDFDFSVGDMIITPNETKVVEYDGEIVRHLIISAKGYDDKCFGQELDESEVVISKDQWTLSDVLVKFESVINGVQCLFNGEEVKGSFKVKPGSYRMLFKKNGYESQSIEFVAKISDGCTIELPRTWTPLPVDVSLQELEDGVRCYLGNSEVIGRVRVLPGRSYEFRYQKDDCVDQRVNVVVETGVPSVVPAPLAWIESTDVKKLTEAERLFGGGKIDEPSKLIAGINLRSKQNLDRLRVLNAKIEKVLVLRESVDLAQDAYRQGDMNECVRCFHVAHGRGYALNAGDWNMVKSAYDANSGELSAQLKSVQSQIGSGVRPFRDPEAIKKDMRQLNEWYNALRK